jgi:hypothetical protein
MFEVPVTPPRHVANVDVQVWDDTRHVTTIKIVEFANYDEPESLSPAVVEQWAAITARIAARLVDEALFERIRHSKSTRLSDLQYDYDSRSVPQ